MALSLDEWQDQLERHFAKIAETRSVSDYPVFALEHGLQLAEFNEIAGLLRERLAQREALEPHWLLWVLYATELGYRYDGVDYWPPFYRETPGWSLYGSPQLLTRWFRQFQRKFGGVEPSGAWAAHFNRISWPITHAVLPKLLQVQFAKALYDVSRDVARIGDLDVPAAGRLIARNSFFYTTRFQEFLQQEELAGRIMLAMLDKKPVGENESVMLPLTLKRLTDDVLKVQAAGDYLRAAQRIVRDRFEGVHRAIPPNRLGQQYFGGNRAELNEPLSPHIILRRANQTLWNVVVELPSFASVARLSGELMEFLKRTRCLIPSVLPSWFPPGYLLYGVQVRSIATWPKNNEPLIRFENSNPVLENIVRKEMQLSTGPTWVFRIGPDGSAREVTSKSVRAKQRYLLISREPIVDEKIPTKPVQLGCAGACAAELEMPEYVTPELTQSLERHSILVGRNIRIWPSGLGVRNWDGEGRGDWLSSEIPCFGLSHDHAVDEYAVRLNNGPEIRLEGTRANSPTFIKLPPLAPGRHLLSVKAKRIGTISSTQSVRDLQGQIDIRVRDPEPWKAGTTNHSGLIVSLDPHDPSLDDFWEGAVALSVHGPEGRSVTCKISLTGPDGHSILSDTIGTFNLPITPTSWRKLLQGFVGSDQRAWQYLDAASGIFSLSGEELGRYELRLERTLKPVRWICRVQAREAEIRLVDDTGVEEDFETAFYPFSEPLTPSVIPPEDMQTGSKAIQPGGLYFARRGAYRDALIVRTPRKASNFSELAVEPRLSGKSDTEELIQLLAAIELWTEARLVGPLADGQREIITHSLKSRLYEILAGFHWRKAENAFLTDKTSGLERIKTAIGGHRSFAAVLVNNTPLIEKGGIEAMQWFIAAASRYQVCNDNELSRFAVRLAASPIGVVKEFKESTVSHLDKLRTMGILFRSARYLALVSQQPPVGPAGYQ